MIISTESSSPSDVVIEYTCAVRDMREYATVSFMIADGGAFNVSLDSDEGSVDATTVTQVSITSFDNQSLVKALIDLSEQLKKSVQY